MDFLEKKALLEDKIFDAVPKVNPFLFWTDSYKDSHIRFEVEGVEYIYSNATARFGKYMQELLGEHFNNEFVVFGIQWMLARFHAMAQIGFFDRPKAEVLEEMLEILGPYIGETDVNRFGDLHDLGYVPLIFKALPEGTVAPIGTPFYTCENTLPEFEWLANFLESGMSTDTWKQLTVATVAYAFRKISNQFALETQGNIEGTEWQNHDFSTRGQSGFESGAINGVAFLLSSCGTDNKPSLWAARDFYMSQNTQDLLLCGSVPAGEHSVSTLGIQSFVKKAEMIGEELSLLEAEIKYAKFIITERFPTGILSYVSDSYDYWGFIKEILPALKEDILARDGKLVVRGDSGDPVHIIAGYRIYDADTDARVRGKFTTISQLMLNTHLWWDAKWEVVKFQSAYYRIVDNGTGTEPITSEEAHGTIQCLWDQFGGVVNELGFKHLDSHIGMIYGDGITVQRSVAILSRLKEKGFASTNIVFGVGSYSLNMLSRDHLGIAIKATNAIMNIEGETVELPIYKDPKTDTSKKSAKGYLVVTTDEDGKIITKDEQTRESALHTGLLETVYMNGQFQVLTTVPEIRERLWNPKPLTPPVTKEEDVIVNDITPEVDGESEEFVE
ncbi:nicotinamide phosphoribosyltransferase [Acinetobacter phage vB_AbaM_P1]|nr:nicotinamide phosphoribosyltransferase [Acinetobacter phage vB_AbaM_P1]